MTCMNLSKGKLFQKSQMKNIANFSAEPFPEPSHHPEFFLEDTVMCWSLYISQAVIRIQKPPSTFMSQQTSDLGSQYNWQALNSSFSTSDRHRENAQ